MFCWVIGSASSLFLHFFLILIVMLHVAVVIIVASAGSGAARTLSLPAKLGQTDKNKLALGLGKVIDNANADKLHAIHIQKSVTDMQIVIN